LGKVSTSGPMMQNWVDAHAPASFGELVGNASVVRKLSEWLRSWDDVVLRGKKKPVAFKPGGGMPENINARAALISGPPGIGKTTTSHLVVKSHGGYDILEYNASDSRGQKVIQEMADGIAGNRTLDFGGGTGKKKVPGSTNRAVIIMDEVDGMGAGDRGGNAALIKMIKKTKNPIICICNDSMSPKVRSLAFSCYDIKFSRPTKLNVAQRCAQIAAREGLEVEQNALEELAESCGSDMRSVINQLQMIAASQSTSVTYMGMKDRLRELSKDASTMMTPFDACKKLLNSSECSRLTFRERLDMFFVDHSLVGLLVQENYLRAVEKKVTDAELLQRCAYSADLITISDMMNAKIRDDQDWNLLPDMGIVGAVFPAHVTNGFIAFPTFPSFLGKYSNMTKMRRLLGELQAFFRLSTTVKRSSLQVGYLDLLYEKLLGPLTRGEHDAVAETVAILDAYGLQKEHLTEHLTELRQHIGGQDLFKGVDQKIKAAMTRELNSGSHAVKMVIPTKKRKAGEKDSVNPDSFEEDDHLDTAADEELKAQEEQSDDDIAGTMIKKGKVKPKAKANAEKKSKAKSARLR